MFVYDASYLGSTNLKWFVEPEHIEMTTNIRVEFDRNTSFVYNNII